MNKLHSMATAMATLIAVCAAPAMAQSSSTEKPTIYTYVSLWSVPRANWSEYAKAEAMEAKMMDKRVDDGDLIASASFTKVVHQEGEPTHGDFITAKNMSGDLKAIEEVLKTPQSTSTVLSGSKHWDNLMESKHYGSKPGTYTNAYMRVQMWTPPAGASDPGDKVLNATLVPLLEKLLASGALCMYQVDEQSIHSEDPGSFYIVMISSNAEGQDAVNTAIADLQNNHPDTLAAYGTLLSGKGHRDWLYRVDTLTIK